MSTGDDTPRVPSASPSFFLGIVQKISFEEGLTKARITGETIRATLARMGTRWERAKRWITSPDPEYQRKKGAATG